MNAKRKGKRGELEACQALRDIGIEARRGQQYQGSPDSPDLVTALPGVHFEVKRTERLRVYDAIEQANADCCVEDVPAVLYRANRKPWLLVLRLNDMEAFCTRVVDFIRHNCTVAELVSQAEESQEDRAVMRAMEEMTG